MKEAKYTEEQIMIRAMPCPDCNAKPRQLCDRRPKQNGLILNHQARQLYFHEFIKKTSPKKRTRIPDIDENGKFMKHEEIT